MKLCGKWLTWLGLVTAIVCIAAGTFLAVTGSGKLAHVADNAFRIDDAVEYVATAGETLVLYENTAWPYSPYHGAVCWIDGPADPEGGVAHDGEFTFDSEPVRPTIAWKFTESGTYTLWCAGGSAVAGPPLPVGGIFGVTGGVLLAVVGGGLGVVMLVVGTLLWAIGARRAHDSAGVRRGEGSVSATRDSPPAPSLATEDDRPFPPSPGSDTLD